MNATTTSRELRATDGASAAAQRPSRLASVDVLRGVAILGMFGYHLTWDLAHFGLIDRTVPFTTAFRLYSHAVACSFLALAGVSLQLSRRQPFRWRRWFVHLGQIGLAALCVTGASAVFFPEGFIGFGILHCIAVSILIATPFLFVRPIYALLAAVFVGVIAWGQWAASHDALNAALNTPALIWTGLGTAEPRSNDFRPLVPWLAPMLAGVGFAGTSAVRRALERMSGWRPAGVVPRVLAWGGRHSLMIYLIHQPLFFGAISGLAIVLPRQAADVGAYTRACEATCVRASVSPGVCRDVCGCVERDLRERDLLARASDDVLDGAERQIIRRVTQQCLRDRRRE